MAAKDQQPFSSNVPHAGGVIAYFNGIEVPCKSVSQRYGVWQIPEMQVELVADPVLQRLGAEDRVQVAAFYLDDTAPDPSVSPRFRLFGEGEITGWGYRNTASGRSIVFTCVNQFAIFTQLFVQFMTSLDDMIAHATFAGKNTLEFASATSQIVYPFSLFKKGLILPTGTSGPDITNPFELLLNVLKGMVGANVPAEQQSVPAANFFSRWARLTNFVNRFAATPVFDEGAGDKNVFPVLKALQTTSAIDVLTKNLIPQIQNAGSIYDMLQLVYQTVFMEIAMIPTMPLVSVDLKTNLVQPTSFDSHKVSAGVPEAPPAATTPSRIPNYFAKPQCLFGIPPSCNVIFPSQVNVYAYDENYATQPTRLYFNDEVVPSVLKVGQSGLGQTIQNALTLAYPPEADAANLLRKANPRTNGKNFLLFPEEFFKGPVMDRRKIPPWLYFLKQAELAAQTTDAIQDNTQGPPGQDAFYKKLQADNPDVYHAYAKYEFFRERYSRRTGSASISFNPYVVPGFPMAIFDQRATRVDVFAYLTTVQQQIVNKGSWSTQLSFTYGRTVQEMFDLMKAEFAAGAPSLGAAPQEPIREVRDALQNFDEAESFYQALFYGKQRLFGKDAAFDWRKVIGYRADVPGQLPERIFVTGPNDAALQRYADAGNTVVTLQPALNDAQLNVARTKAAKTGAEKTLSDIAALLGGGPPSPSDQIAIDQANAVLNDATIKLEQLTQQLTALEAQMAAAQAVLAGTTVLQQNQVVHNLDGTREIVPLPGAEKMFASYDAAAQYNWRPICTLDEYIIFYNSRGEGLVPANKHPRSWGAPYYDRIRRLTPLTADFQFPAGADGLSPATGTNPGAGTQSAPDAVTGDTTTQAATRPTVVGLGKGFPQTRADWDSILLAYRNNVYSVKSPRI